MKGGYNKFQDIYFAFENLAAIIMKSRYVLLSCKVVVRRQPDVSQELIAFIVRVE
jgi:hypothetical protein